MIYIQYFERQNFNLTPAAAERVVVFVETDSDPENDLEAYEEAAWKALWRQYPIWDCPFNSASPATTEFERLRHGFSSPSIRETTQTHPATQEETK